MTKYLMTNDERMTNNEIPNDETPRTFFVICSFGIRHSFVIGYFVIG